MLVSIQGNHGMVTPNYSIKHLHTQSTSIIVLRVHATIARLRAFQLENTLGRSSETEVTLGMLGIDS